MHPLEEKHENGGVCANGNFQLKGDGYLQKQGPAKGKKGAKRDNCLGGGHRGPKKDTSTQQNT